MPKRSKKIYLFFICFILFGCSKETHYLSGEWENSASGLEIQIDIADNRVEYIETPQNWIAFYIKEIRAETIKREKQKIPVNVFILGLKDIETPVPKNLNSSQRQKFRKEMKQSIKEFEGKEAIMRIYSSKAGVIYAQITHPLEREKGFSQWLEFDLMKKL